MDKDGKKLENWTVKYFKENNLYYHRFYDAKSGVFVKQPADFFVYSKFQLYYIECKHTEKTTSIPLTSFRPYQLKEARDAHKNGIIYIAIIEFDTEKKYLNLGDFVNQPVLPKSIKKSDIIPIFCLHL